MNFNDENFAVKVPGRGEVLATKDFWRALASTGQSGFGRKIKAIKNVRETTLCGLIEAKWIVENIDSIIREMEE
jgi:ribosomal protein L7/L12